MKSLERRLAALETQASPKEGVTDFYFDDDVSGERLSLDEVYEHISFDDRDELHMILEPYRDPKRETESWAHSEEWNRAEEIFRLAIERRRRGDEPFRRCRNTCQETYEELRRARGV
jgi:hypothetical protein